MTAVISTGGSNESIQYVEKRPPLLASRLWLVGLTIGALALICLSGRDGLLNLYDRWTHEDEYGYGFLIAALVPFLLWKRRGLLLSASNETRWPGLLMLLVVQLCTILAAAGESYYVEQVAVILSILSVGLVLFGMGAFRVLLPLAVLMLLTVPLPYTLQAILTIKLQLLSTDLGVVFIRLIGMPVYVEGNIIDLGGFQLQVAEACSGLRYLLPLICISFLAAYLYKARFWKKAIVVFSAGPLTILTNSFRIAVTAVLVDKFGNQMAEGFIHQFEGWFIFLAAVFLLGIEIFILEGFRWPNLQLEETEPSAGVSKVAISIRAALPLALATVICAGGLGATAAIASLSSSASYLPRANFVDFPRQVADWRGAPQDLEPGIADTLKATDYYLGNFYRSSNTPPVNVFVAYYDSLSKGAAIHSPRVCLPGSGWEFVSFEERNFAELGSGIQGTYNRVLIQNGTQKMLMYYWYQMEERRVANEFNMKYYLLVDSFSRGRKDGALVRFATPIADDAGGAGEREADSRLRAFAQASLPKLRAYLPE